MVADFAMQLNEKKVHETKPELVLLHGRGFIIDERLPIIDNLILQIKLSLSQGDIVQAQELLLDFIVKLLLAKHQHSEIASRLYHKIIEHLFQTFSNNHFRTVILDGLLNLDRNQIQLMLSSRPEQLPDLTFNAEFAYSIIDTLRSDLEMNLAEVDQDSYQTAFWYSTAEDIVLKIVTKYRLEKTTTRIALDNELTNFIINNVQLVYIAKLKRAKQGSEVLMLNLITSRKFIDQLVRTIFGFLIHIKAFSATPDLESEIDRVSYIMFKVIQDIAFPQNAQEL